MAEKNDKPMERQAPIKADAIKGDVGTSDKPPDKQAFRRQAALAILGAYVGRHGGFTPAEREAHMRLVWEYADAFVSLEHAPPPRLDPVPSPADRPHRRTRPVAPNDEWGVRDGDVQKRGFVSREEAEWYAAARPGAEVVQIDGPEIAAAALVAADV